MERIEKTVFICYRRTNRPWALAIYQNLTNHGYDVFCDFSGIASGDFESVILGNIRARAHFLVLLTPSALENCGKPGDWLRREIETAMEIKRNVVPLMLDLFDFNSPAVASRLTGKLAALKSYNGLSVPGDYFMEAMERLRGKYLNLPLHAVLHPASLAVQQATQMQKAAANTAPAVAQEELTAQQWFERGFGAADPDEKIRFYGQAIQLKPDYVEAFINGGSARYAKGDMDGALQDYNEAIRLKPDVADAFYNRALLFQGRRPIPTGRRAGVLHFALQIIVHHNSSRRYVQDDRTFYCRCIIAAASGRPQDANGFQTLNTDFQIPSTTPTQRYDALLRGSTTKQAS